MGWEGVVRNVSRIESRVLLSLSPELSFKDMEQTGPRQTLMAGPEIEIEKGKSFYALTGGTIIFILYFKL